MDNINEKFCPVCGIKQVTQGDSSTYYWTSPVHKGNPRVIAPPNAVYTRVCRYAKNKSECLNKGGKVEDLYAYPSEGQTQSVDVAVDSMFPVMDYDQMAKDVLDSLENNN